MSKPASSALRQAFQLYCQALQNGDSPWEAQRQVRQSLGDHWTASVAKSLSRKLRQEHLPRPGTDDHVSDTEAERQIRQVIRQLRDDLRQFRQHERAEYATLQQQWAERIASPQHPGRQFETFSPTDAQNVACLQNRSGRPPSLRWLHDMAVYTAPVTAWEDILQRHREQYARDRDQRLHEAWDTIQHILNAVHHGTEGAQLWHLVDQAWPVSRTPETPVVTAWVPRPEPIRLTRERIVDLDTWAQVDAGEESGWTGSTAGASRRNRQGHRWRPEVIAGLDR